MKLFTTLVFLILTAGHLFTQDIGWSSNRPENTLIKGCGKGEFTLTNEGNKNTEIEIELTGQYDSDQITANVQNIVQLASGVPYTFTIEIAENSTIRSGDHIIIRVSAGEKVLHEKTIRLENELFLNTSVEGDFTACIGEDIQLTAISNATVTWQPGKVGGDTFDLSFLETTEILVTAHQGSCMESAQFTIESKAEVAIDYDRDTLFLCKGDAPARITATSENSNSVVWSSEGFLFGQEPGNAVSVDPKSSGMLFATVTVDDCSVTDTLWIRVDSLPEMVLDTVPHKDPYCPGEIVSIYGMKLQQDRFPDATYEWTPASGILSDAKKANLTITTTDTITYVRTTRNNACESDDSITLNVDNPPVELTLTDTLICPGQTVEIELLNPEKFKSYEWGPEEEVSCTKCPKTKVSPMESTVVTLQLETEHCPVSANVNVGIKPPRPITIEGSGPVCPEEDIQLIALEAAEYVRFEWSGSVNFSCRDCPDPMISSDGINSASLLAVDEEGCLGAGNFLYEIYDLPSVSIGTEPEVVAQGEEITAMLITDQTQDFSDIVWKVNGQVSDQTSEKAKLVMASETNEIEVTALTTEGCPVSARLTIQADPPSYRIPNAFTPNGTSNNIFRVITNGNVTVDRMRIFTRWSQLIFTDQSGKGWDGRQNGKAMPSDTYVYIIEMTLPDGRKIERTSEVTLIN